MVLFYILTCHNILVYIMIHYNVFTLYMSVYYNIHILCSDSSKHIYSRYSNVVRNVSIPPVHGAMWASGDSPGETKRFMLHTERNQVRIKVWRNRI
jgi:hypothetical protein